MIGYKKLNNDKSFGIDYFLPARKKPCLVICEGNKEIKVASFNNEESAKLFMDFVAEFVNSEKIDWTGDDIPIGLRSDF